MTSKRIAIIGAGLSGLVLARRLASRADVRVFEKSRGPGGRAATRRVGDYSFDHGTQFFTARTRPFRAFLEPLRAAGVVADWPARFAELDDGPVDITSLEEFHRGLEIRIGPFGIGLAAGQRETRGNDQNGFRQRRNKHGISRMAELEHNLPHRLKYGQRDRAVIALTIC